MYMQNMEGNAMQKEPNNSALEQNNEKERVLLENCRKFRRKVLIEYLWGGFILVFLLPWSGPLFLPIYIPSMWGLALIPVAALGLVFYSLLGPRCPGCGRYVNLGTNALNRMFILFRCPFCEFSVYDYLKEHKEPKEHKKQKE